MKRIWITWEEQVRNIELSKAFGAKYFCLWDLRKSKRNILSKYWSVIKKTIEIIKEERPDTLMCQNPSFVLAGLAVLLKKVYGYKVVVDTHNFSIDPTSPWFIRTISKYIRKFSDITIVSNNNLVNKINDGGQTIIALPDKLPSIKKTTNKKKDGNINVLYLCTFSKDEPFREVLAMKNLNSNISVFISGNNKKTNIAAPKQIMFTGFLSRQDLEKLMNSVDIIMVLTTREDCLVCGGYEAVAIKKPLILSKTDALQKYFFGAHFTENTSDAIAQAINEVAESLVLHQQLSASMKRELGDSWTKNFNAVINTLREIEG